MVWVFNSKGEAVSDVAPEHLAEAMRTGLRPRAADRIAVSIGDQKGTIAASDLPALASSGGRVRTAQELQHEANEAQFGGIGQTALAGVEGAARGASIGLSDVLLGQALGKQYAREAALRRDINPYAAGAGEVIGTVAPMLIGDEAGAANVAKGAGELGEAARGASALSRGLRGGETVARTIGAPVRATSALGRGVEGLVGSGLERVGLTGESIAGRAAKRGLELAAGQTTEGAVYGAGQALSEAALAPDDDYQGLGEKLLVGMKQGAITGALAGGTLGALGGASSAAVDRGVQLLSGADGLKATLQKFAAGRTAKAIGFRGTDLRKLGHNAGSAEAKLQTMARDVLDYTLDDGTKLFRARDKASDIVDRVERARSEVGEKLGAFREEVGKFNAAHPEFHPDSEALYKQIDSEVLEPLRSSDVADVRKLATKVARNVEDLRPKLRYDDGSLVPAAKIDKAIADGSGHMTPESFDLDRLTQMRVDLDAIIHPKQVNPGLPSQPSAKLAELEKTRAIVEHQIEQTTESTTAAMGDPTHTLDRYLELKHQYGSFKTASQVSGKASLQDLGNRYLSPSDYGTGAVAAQTGIIGAALHGGVAGAVHAGPVGLAIGVGAAIAHKVVRERGASVLAVLADRAARSDMQISSAVREFFKPAGVARRSITAARKAANAELARSAVRSETDIALQRKQNETRQQAYYAMLAKISKARTLAQQGALHNAAVPRSSAAANGTLARATQYLLDAAPAQPTHDPTALLTGRAKPHPDPVALARWARKVAAIDHPIVELSHALHAGTLTKDQVDAVRQTYPAIYDQFRGQVARQIGKLKHPMPYVKRVQLGLLLQLPTDPSLEPAAIAMAQQAYQRPEPGATTPPLSAGKPIPIKQIGQHAMTATSRLQAGRI